MLRKFHRAVSRALSTMSMPELECAKKPTARQDETIKEFLRKRVPMG
jgi:hypothetical protein